MSEEIENVALRRLQQSDYAELLAFFQRNDTPEVTRNFNPFPLNEKTARSICEERLDLYFVAISQRQILGLSMLRGWSEGFSVPSFGILIDCSRIGRGLGRRMTEFTLMEAKAARCEQVRLSVYGSNARALQLYLSLGFVEIQRRPINFGAGSDEKIIMIKALTS